jgi:hypothetical protein
MNSLDKKAVEFFNSIPKDVLVELATYEWKTLQRMCAAITLDLQIIREKLKKDLDY